MSFEVFKPEPETTLNRHFVRNEMKSMFEQIADKDLGAKTDRTMNQIRYHASILGYKVYVQEHYDYRVVFATTITNKENTNE